MLRETTPAPPDSQGSWDKNFPSGRPTFVPDYDVAALAFETSLRHPPLPSLPIDMTVPRRTGLVVPDDLGLRSAFLLMHVDGCSSVQDVADRTALPVAEVLAALLELAALGLVELGGSALAGRAVPSSGER